MYEYPMFMVTVSVVLIIDNGVIIVDNKFPGGMVKAGQETLQFAAVRYVKEQTGITLTKEALIPVDFRSNPERSEGGNVIDIGFVVMVNKNIESLHGKWVEVDFNLKKIVNSVKLYMDHEILLERAIDIALMVK